MNRAQFNYVQPYFLEKWYLRCRRFTIPTVILPLDAATAQALALPAAVSSAGRLAALNAAITQAMREVAGEGPAFVRLGTRSPKDVTDFRERRGRTRLSFEAIHWLRSSKRIADDLADCRRYGYSPVIAVRPWLDIPLWSELRCFVRDGKIIGLSQFHLHIGPAPELIESATKIESVVHHFASEVMQAAELQSGALDLFVARDQAGQWTVRLIEINPMMPLTDSLLFSWHGTDMNGAFRYLTTETAEV